MNKEQILDCYTNPQTPENLTKNLFKQHPSFFRATAYLPENLKPIPSAFSGSQSRMTSEIEETLSFYTALSRLTIEQSLLDDVQINLANHLPFEAIDESKQENFKWYYEQKDGGIHGPLNAGEMDSRYQLGRFGKGTKVKTREDDSYYPFINILKRYCRILKQEKLDMFNQPKQLSNKIKKFKKGEVVKKRSFMGMNMVPGEFGMKKKEGRTRTYAPRPVFDLNSLVKEAEKAQKQKLDPEDEDDDVPPETRGRANTHV
jgi:hypothetical protein